MQVTDAAAKQRNLHDLKRTTVSSILKESDKWLCLTDAGASKRQQTAKWDKIETMLTEWIGPVSSSCNCPHSLAYTALVLTSLALLHLLARKGTVTDRGYRACQQDDHSRLQRLFRLAQQLQGPLFACTTLMMNE